MDTKPADEIELEDRPNADADDDFLGTLPDVPKEAKTQFDTIMREINLEAENTVKEINKLYNYFPDYNVDRSIRSKAKFSLQPKTNRLRIKVSGRPYFNLSSERYPYNFLRLSTIASNYGKGGADFVRNVLGFKIHNRFKTSNPTAGRSLGYICQPDYSYTSRKYSNARLRCYSQSIK